MSTLFTSDGARKYVTASEGWRLLDEVAVRGERLAALCAVLMLSGCRLSEALALRAEHVDSGGGAIRLRTLKRRNGQVVWRSVPMPDDILALIEKLPATNSGRLFPWSRATAWRQIKAAMSDAGISGAHACPKGLRHRFGVTCAAEGVPIALIQRWMGHAKLENTLIYMQAVGEEERQLAARTWGQARQFTLDRACRASRQ